MTFRLFGRVFRSNYYMNCFCLLIVAWSINVFFLSWKWSQMINKLRTFLCCLDINVLHYVGHFFVFWDSFCVRYVCSLKTPEMLRCDVKSLFPRRLFFLLAVLDFLTSQCNLNLLSFILRYRLLWICVFVFRYNIKCLMEDTGTQRISKRVAQFQALSTEPSQTLMDVSCDIPASVQEGVKNSVWGIGQHFLKSLERVISVKVDISILYIL